MASAKSPLIESSQIAYADTNEELGKGGFGVVRLGQFDGQSVAVKSLFLNNDNVDPLGAAELFLSEAKNMRELEHARIVKFLGFIMESFSIVMEYMPGGTLEDHIAKNKDMPWMDRYQLAEDVAEGMAYLHAKKTPDGRKKRDLFHQDLKSANVLLCTEQGRLRGKISDFGLSVIRDKATIQQGEPSRMATNSNTAKSYVVHVGGTRTYMAPELQQSSKFTKECDVYAYGVILLELSTSLDPVGAITDFRFHLDRFSIPKIVKQLIVGCLSLDPTKRPSFETAYTQLHAQEAENFKWELISPLEDEDASVMVDEDKKFKGKKGEFSYASDFYDDSALVSRATAGAPSILSKGKHKTDADYDRDFDFTGKKERRRKIYIALLIGVLVILIVGLGVGIKFLTAPPSTENISLQPQLSASPSTSQSRASTTVSISRTSRLTTTTTTTVSIVPTIPPDPYENVTLPATWEDLPSFGGVNSFFLHALSDEDQDEIVENLRKANVKVIRVFILVTQQYAKKSSADPVPDVEPVTPGVYDDTILERIDSLMVRTHKAGIKLLINMHDRYALGCWNTDAYATFFKLPIEPSCGSVYNSPAKFYSSSNVTATFDNRLKRIVSHRNPHLANRTWGSLSEAIYAFDIQHSSQAHMGSTYIKRLNWLCDRAAAIRSLVTNGVKIATGGGEDFTNSVLEAYFNCSHIDIVSIRDDNTDISTLVPNLKTALNMSRKYNKSIIMETFCSPDRGTDKYPGSLAMIQSFNSLQVPWLIWQVMKPNNPKDCEFYVEDTKMWNLLTTRARHAMLGITNVTDSSVVAGKGDWEFCTVSGECRNSCCSNEYSDDGKLKCTPGGTSCT